MKISTNDRNNLAFLMSLNTDADWNEWASTVSEDDIQYALDLLHQVMDSRQTMHSELDKCFE